jgi:hypothetical protein
MVEDKTYMEMRWESEKVSFIDEESSVFGMQGFKSTLSHMLTCQASIIHY